MYNGKAWCSHYREHSKRLLRLPQELETKKAGQTMESMSKQPQQKLRKHVSLEEEWAHKFKMEKSWEITSQFLRN